MLSRIPMPFLKESSFNGENIRLSLVFFPVVGLFYGLIIYYTAVIGLKLNMSIEIISLLLIFLPYLLNKFYHFDGLCDCLDAFLADRTREERLSIMKDSRIGSFALGGAVLFIISKWIVLKKIIHVPELINSLILLPIFSKYGMVLLSYLSKYPKKKGSASDIVGKINSKIMIISTIILLAILILLCKFTPIKIILIVSGVILIVVFTILMKVYSTKKIGGVTGDVLGMQNEAIEWLLPVLFLFLLTIGVS